MVEIEKISQYGLDNVLMNVSDLIMNHSRFSSQGEGLQLEHTWITPEGCYWLYMFLSSDKTGFLVSPKVLNLLKQGTNHPNLL